VEQTAITSYFDFMSKVRKSYARHMDAVCKKWGLTRNEQNVLLFLHNNPRFDRAADIVARRGIAKSHVSLSVSNLEGRGLLERRFDAADRRTAHLELTAQGRQIAGEARLVQQAFYRALFRGITGEEIEVWKKITRTVCDNIEKIDETQGDP